MMMKALEEFKNYRKEILRLSVDNSNIKVYLSVYQKLFDNINLQIKYDTQSFNN